MQRILRRRRLEYKTDYRSRMDLLKSPNPRLVVRKTNRYVIVQLVESEVAQDKIIMGTTSKVLLSKGWPEAKQGSLKSIAAAYLTGRVIGHMAKGKVDEAILDMGMHRNIQKSRIYAVLKGAVDAGLKISCDEKVLPTDETLESNKNTREILTKLKDKI